MKIIGIVLVKNEDRFLDQVLKNLLGFCDTIHFVNHHSGDQSVEIAHKLSRKYPSIICHDIQQPSESHDIIAGYAGQDVWMFGVDGDEIYDPHGLAKLRQELLSGAYADQWVLFGNVLNCTEYSESSTTARGYLSPPCRSMTKLYNFSVIESWGGNCPERLHGGEIVFRAGVDLTHRFNYHELHDWEASDFRCLHMCFMARSSLEFSGSKGRMNLADITQLSRIQKICFKLFGHPLPSGGSNYKEDKYMRGELVEKEVTLFFSSKDKILKHEEFLNGKEL